MLSGILPITFAVLDHLALALICALAVAALWTSPSATQDENAKRTKLLILLCIVTFFTAVVELWLRAAVMADVSLAEAWSFMPKVLSHSDYGFYWFIRIAAWSVLVGASIWILRRGWRVYQTSLVLLSTLLIILLKSANSHAGEEGVYSIPNLMNWAHLISTYLWGGMVTIYAILLLPMLVNQSASLRLTCAIERLSTMAGIALAVVLITGIYNTWNQLNTLSDFWLTDYGQVLAIKLACVSLMILVGSLNRFLWVPELIAWLQDNNHQWGLLGARFLKILKLDSLVFVAVLVAAVVLGTESPPIHEVQ